MSEFVIALVGNPNTGKSTVFNALTGLKQHTGNWSGKTVESAEGQYTYKGKKFKVVDLPGIYSFYSDTAEEKASKEFICSQKADMVLVIADSLCLERNLNLCFQTMDMFDDVVLCLNLMDEAQKHNIKVDSQKLSEKLDIPVICASARFGVGIDNIKETAFNISEGNFDIKPYKANFIDMEDEERSLSYMGISEETAFEVVKKDNNMFKFQRTVDGIILSKKFGIPIVLFMLTAIFLITAKLANYPSQALGAFFGFLGLKLEAFIDMLGASDWVKSLILDGVFGTTSFVVSVMLPPMAVFFPLFTFMEDCGFLPRIAFCLDGLFRKADAHGKQAITSMMAMGCNAAAIANCRIIGSTRERIMAILTNNFIPCNGRFPLIIVLTSIFITAENSLGTSVCIVGFMVVAIAMMLLVSFILSKTLLKGMSASFILEMPPYRKPQIGKILVRSILDRTIFVLGRAVTAALPAGVIIWIMQNTVIGGTNVMLHISNFLDGPAKIMGLNGIILTAFLIGFPANETVLPIIFMCLGGAASVGDIADVNVFANLLFENGWTIGTAVCTILFSINHFPCATTLLTIKKETHSLKWTVAAFFIPLIAGVVLCSIVNLVFQII